MYFILFYDYVENIVERRVSYREAHLAWLGQYVARDELVLGGALAGPVDGAVLVFKTDDRAKVEDFVANDPYFLNGLVTGWRIREWSVVVGTAV